MKYIQIYANPEMCLKYLFLGSKRSVLTELIFVQGNNHAADDINSCEFSVNAADHIILCCMDFRIFWNFFMLQDTQKSNAVRHYKFMLSWHSILCCSWQIWKRLLHFFVWTAAFLTVSFHLFLCSETIMLLMTLIHVNIQ